MAKKCKKLRKISGRVVSEKTEQRKANVQYQDSLFRTLFSDKEKAIGGKTHQIRDLGVSRMRPAIGFFQKPG